MKEGIIESLLSFFLQKADWFSINTAHISKHCHSRTPVYTRLKSFKLIESTPAFHSSTVVFWIKDITIRTFMLLLLLLFFLFLMHQMYNSAPSCNHFGHHSKLINIWWLKSRWNWPTYLKKTLKKSINVWLTYQTYKLWWTNMKCPSLDITYILSLRPNFFYSEYFTTEGHQRQLFEKENLEPCVRGWKRVYCMM